MASPLMESLLKWNRPQSPSLSLQDVVVHHQLVQEVEVLPEAHEGPEEHQVECEDHLAENPFLKVYHPEVHPHRKEDPLCEMEGPHPRDLHRRGQWADAILHQCQGTGTHMVPLPAGIH